LSFAGLKTYILYIVIFYINTEYSVLNAPIMQKTILWEAFSTLDKAELREMGKFVRSPFFNQKQPLIDLFEYLCDCLKQKKIPDTLSAHAAVWPDILYDDQRMRLANSDLLELLGALLDVLRAICGTPTHPNPACCPIPQAQPAQTQPDCP